MSLQRTATAIPTRVVGSKQGAGRFVAIALLLFGAVHEGPASAATRLEIDPAVRGIRIEVDEDAPPVIELKSDDLLTIRWERDGLRRAVLPVVLVRDANDLVIVDDAAVSHALTYDGYLNRVRIMPDFREFGGDWHGQPSAQQRNQIVWAAILFALGLLLVMLSRKRTTTIAVAYCVIWIAAIAVLEARRPQVVTSEDLGFSLFRPYYARSTQTWRVPIIHKSYWIPVVESMDQLRSLNARIEASGDRSWLVLDLQENTTLGLDTDFKR